MLYLPSEPPWEGKLTDICDNRVCYETLCNSSAREIIVMLKWYG